MVAVSNLLTQNQFNPIVTLPAASVRPDYLVKTLDAVNVSATTANIETATITGRLACKRGGTATLTGGALTQVVTFAGLGLPNMPNGNYAVFQEVVDQNQAAWATGRSTSQFTINIATNGGTRVVRWLINDPT